MWLWVKKSRRAWQTQSFSHALVNLQKCIFFENQQIMFLWLYDIYSPFWFTKKLIQSEIQVLRHPWLISGSPFQCRTGNGKVFLLDNRIFFHLNNYFNFHVCLSIRPSVHSFVCSCVRKLASIPTLLSQNVMNKRRLVCVNQGGCGFPHTPQKMRFSKADFFTF